ncbi:MAG TPA: mechanosensitive ion channel domain-containing protein [Bacteroidales bacterium]|nr:mechanosensitive ion channel domain-containing protein [Bacteroidales bacterium]
MKENLGVTIEKLLMDLGLNFEIAEVIAVMIILVLITMLGWLADFLTKRILLGLLQRVIRRTKTLWDDILLEKKLFSRIAHFAPAIVVYYTIDYAFPNVEVLTTIIEKGAQIFMIIISIMVINAFLNGVNEIYDRTTGKERGTSIKSYVQVLKIIAFALLGFGIISVIFNIEVGKIITGIGALAAVLILVFRDSILGLVAGVQLSANDMVRLGDWISMPQRNADGPVTEITLNTVKVQNWDKTIATIPTYALISESFNNWRGMEESGGRRISKSINLDINSIHYCTEDEIKKIEETIESGDKIIKELRENNEPLTNSAIYRKHLLYYMRKATDIYDEMICMVRYNDPTSKGIPVQMYTFSKIQSWVEYEQVQARLLDHAMSVLHKFNLKVFQEPTGLDLERARNNQIV